MMSWHKTVSAMLFASAVASLSAPSFATQATLTESQNAIAVDARQAVNSQNKVNKLDDDYQALLQDYRATNGEIDQLKLYNQQMSKIVANQESELSKIDQQIRDIEFTEQGILPLMSQMLDALEQFNDLDLPFLMKEREVRLAKLRELMTRADITVSEKYRRVLEAFQIEVEYGRTLETYREKADDNIVVLNADTASPGHVAAIRVEDVPVHPASPDGHVACPEGLAQHLGHAFRRGEERVGTIVKSP